MSLAGGREREEFHLPGIDGFFAGGEAMSVRHGNGDGAGSEGGRGNPSVVSGEGGGEEKEGKQAAHHRDFRTIGNLVARTDSMNASCRLLWLSLWLGVVCAVAHELDLETTLAPPAAIVRAAYGGATPVAFAKVQVFAPGSEAGEFQTGMTDRRGYFSFVPEQAGEWRVVVDDEEGHRREIKVTIPAAYGETTARGKGEMARWERAVLGVAMLFGATGFLYGFKARRRA